MRARTNLTGAVAGSTVIFDNGYQGKIIEVSFTTVKVSVPLRTGNGVKLYVHLSKDTGMDVRVCRLKEVKLFPSAKEISTDLKAVVIEHANEKKDIVNPADLKGKIKEYSVNKVEKGKFQVLVVDMNNKTRIIDKRFKSSTSANEWCATHLRTK